MEQGNFPVRICGVPLVRSRWNEEAANCKTAGEAVWSIQGEAADQLDRVVNEILSNLRSGNVAPLPGLGTFVPGRTWEFQFEKPKVRGK